MSRSRRTRSTRSSRSSLVCASTEPKGSSIRSSTGSAASARAIATRCCMPPDSCRGYLSPTPLIPPAPASPTAASEASAAFRRAARARVARRSGSATLSLTVSHGYSDLP
jgi:hypothetical protein